MLQITEPEQSTNIYSSPITVRYVKDRPDIQLELSDDIWIVYHEGYCVGSHKDPQEAVKFALQHHKEKYKCQ